MVMEFAAPKELVHMQLSSMESPPLLMDSLRGASLKHLELVV